MEMRSARTGVTATQGIAIVISVIAVVSVVFVVFNTMPSQLATSSSTTSTTTSASASVTDGGTTSTTATSSTASYIYLSSAGDCAAGGKPAPCWGSPAYVFDCLSAAGSSQGCTQLVITTTADWNYTVNIRYPFDNQTGPSWANCLWSVQVPVQQGYGHCTQVNSTSFTIGQPAPPPQ